MLVYFGSGHDVDEGENLPKKRITGIAETDDDPNGNETEPLPN